MDEIHIKNLEVFAKHGVFAEENRLGQKFIVNVILYTDTRLAGKQDELTKSIHYGEAAAFITRFMQEHTYQLIEAAAEQLAQAMLVQISRLQAVELEIKKPWAPVGLPLETVSVRIRRSWHTAYIALGSNMGDKEGYLNFAVDSFKANSPLIEVEKVSSYLETEPYGGVEQDDFLNAVMRVRTTFTAHELWQVMADIEKKAKRVRQIHWGPRTLDLDLLFYDEDIIGDEDLVVPHPEIEKRDFVLKPLVEIAPWLRHPISHKTMSQLLQEWETFDAPPTVR